MHTIYSQKAISADQKNSKKRAIVLLMLDSRDFTFRHLIYT